jgi:hypothetical protein
MGDAGCVDMAGAPDPTQDCVDTGNGCECQPRICCTCENVGTSTGCDPFPCQDTALGSIFLCVLPCFIADAGLTSGPTCNLKVVFKSPCVGGDCPTTGCCAFQFCQNPGTQGVCNDPGGFSQLCAETNSTTCDQTGGTFVPDGSCDSLFGQCVSPTPSSTPTNTPSATPSSTPTQTPTQTFTSTGTATRTNTATSTRTGTNTATATGTATRTNTATRTATNTNTATRTATNTGTVTRTSTATATTSATPTQTKIPNGGECVTPSQCRSDFCVDGVCCNNACTTPGFICNGPTPGICAMAAAAAPTLSAMGLLVGLGALTLVAALALLWRSRPES